MVTKPNLEKLKEKKDVQGLIRALYYEDVYVQSKASAALIEIGEPAVEPLILALKDGIPHVRWIAASDLRVIGDARAVEPLINAIMTDPERDVRWHAVEALEEIGDVRAIEPLTKALKDGDSYVREAAKMALEKMKSKTQISELKDDSALVFCPQCGKKLVGAPNFCSECGNRIRLPQEINKKPVAKVDSDMPAVDGVMSGEVCKKVLTERDIQAGDVIRIWNQDTKKWIPGWWYEILRIEHGNIYYRDLMSGKEGSRGINSIMGRLGGITWKHPNPNRIKEFGTKLGNIERDRLQNLKSFYESLDFSKSSDDELSKFLVDELNWLKLHDREFLYNQEEFEIRMNSLHKIGEELNQQGGKPLMLWMFEHVNGTRLLEMIWGGIGDWRA